MFCSSKSVMKNWLYAQVLIQKLSIPLVIPILTILERRKIFNGSFTSNTDSWILFWHICFISVLFNSCPDRDCSVNLQPSIDLKLQAVCEDPCISFQLTYLWELSELSDGNQWSPINIPANLYMETTNREFIVKSAIFQNILGPGDEFVVHLEVRREGGRAAYITKTLKINEPPKIGNCSCIPPTGELSNTEFQVFCDGWTDPDTPLRYSFRYGEDEKPLLTSLENPRASRKFRIYKQLAEDIPSIAIPIKVSVADALGMSSEIGFSLEVLLSLTLNFVPLVLCSGYYMKRSYINATSFPVLFHWKLGGAEKDPGNEIDITPIQPGLFLSSLAFETSRALKLW